MNKTNKKTLEEIIRVDHAGERGAIKIYEGQLLALKTFKQNEFLKKKIEDMWKEELDMFVKKYKEYQDKRFMRSQHNDEKKSKQKKKKKLTIN